MAHAIEFLSRTGHLCASEGLEFVLVSDVLGVTMLVDEVNRRGHTEATEKSVLGLFCRTECPAAANGPDIFGGVPGRPACRAHRSPSG